MKNERSRESALFFPSPGRPLRSFFIAAGYMSSVIISPFMLIPLPSYFLACSFGFNFSYSLSAESRRYSASPSTDVGMKFFVFVIFNGSASEGLKESICSISNGIEARAVFSWSEYGARKRWRGDTRTTSTESSVDFIVISSLNFGCAFFCRTPPKREVFSILTVDILQDSQKSTSRSSFRFIFALQDGQSIATLFFVKLSIWPLHRMSGQIYL